MASAVQTEMGAIEARLRDNIATVEPAWGVNHIAWPGVPFDPPDDGWIRPTILWGDSVLETMSSGGTNTLNGIAVFQLFDRPQSGYGVLHKRADNLRDLFDRVTLSSTEMLAASGPRRIENDDGRWLQVNVTIPFIVEETS